MTIPELKMKLFLFVIAILPQVSPSDDTPCTWAAYHHCNQQLPVMGKDIIPDLTDPELGQICSTLDRARPCFETLRQSCEEAGEVIVDVTETPEQSGYGSTVKRETRNATDLDVDISTGQSEPGESETSPVEDSTTASTTTPSPPTRTTTTTNTTTLKTTTPTRTTTVTSKTTSLRYEDPDEVGSHHESGKLQRKKIVQATNETVDVLSYLCDTTNSAVYKSKVRPCLTDHMTDLHLSGETCLQKYVNKTWWLNKDLPENVYKFCSAASNYLDCLKDGVSGKCGSEPSAWVVAFHEALFTSHFNDIACLYGGGMQAGAIAIISICGAAAGMAVFFTILGFVVKPKKKEEKGITRNGSVSALKNNGTAPTLTGATVSKGQADIYPDKGILKKRTRPETIPE